MVCDACMDLPPLGTIEVNGNLECVNCGERIGSGGNAVESAEHTKHDSQVEWDSFFLDICKTISYKSACLSRQIGAILVRDKSIVATGYNGPARGIVHCGKERFEDDLQLANMIHGFERPSIYTKCPRQLMDLKSGQGLEWCLAEHAERNTIANAARLGVSVLNTTLYMNCIIPCKDCINLLINAGISEIVVTSTTPYDHYGEYILKQSHIMIREFEDDRS